MQRTNDVERGELDRQHYVRRVYPEPGVMKSRVRKSGSWGQAVTLPNSAYTGSGVDGAMARAGNGHALAVWRQYDAELPAVYAGEFDGCNWQS